MPLPPHLLSLVDQAQSALRGRPARDLILGYRRAIWTAMGPRCDTLAGCPGWLRRVHLARLSAEFVLPIWEAHWRGDDTPQRLLSAARQVADGALNRPVAERIWRRWFDIALPEQEPRVRQNAWEMIHCAGQVLATALWDERYDAGDENLAVTDLDVNPDEHDASFFAAGIFCGGGTWEGDSDPARRQEFWEWWLTSAVPTAFHSAGS